MENLKGRYIKVLRSCLGGKTNMYKVGDYLEVLEDDGDPCIQVKYAGILHVRKGIGYTRIETGDIELMPVGFNPKHQLNYEIY